MAEHTGKDVLSRDVEIKGSIKFQKELMIDGKVEGEINSEGVLTIGENADIRGEIKTKSITVYGKVHGNITVGERCELKSRCTLQGDLKAARLVIEEGATFIGKSEVTSGKVQPSANSSSSSRPEIVRNDEAPAPKAAFASRPNIASARHICGQVACQGQCGVSTLRLQADGVCRGQEHALPAVRQALSRWPPPKRVEAKSVLASRRARSLRNRCFSASKAFGIGSALRRSSVSIAGRRRN